MLFEKSGGWEQVLNSEQVILRKMNKTFLFLLKKSVTKGGWGVALLLVLKKIRKKAKKTGFPM